MEAPRSSRQCTGAHPSVISQIIYYRGVQGYGVRGRRNWTRVKVGVQELDQEKLSPLLKLTYKNAIADAVAESGRPEEIRGIFAGFQRYLYQEAA
jgi:hypothetical protein